MKDFKRKLYAIALAGLIMTNSNIIANAESLDDVDMTPIDIGDAIVELVPDDNGSSNNGGSDNQNTDDNQNTNDNEDNDLDNDNQNTDNNQDNNEELDDDNTHFVVDNDDVCVSHRYNSAADDVINQVAPSCTSSGSYTEIYYCLDGGSAKSVDVVVAAPGHNMSTGEVVNKDDNGYDIEYHCTNKGCNHVTYDHVVTPTEPQPTEPTETVPTETTEPAPTVPTETVPTETTEPSVPVKTGDDSHIELYSALFLASGLGLGIMGKIAANNKRKNNDIIYEPKFLDETIAEKKVKKHKGKYLTRK